MQQGLALRRDVLSGTTFALLVSILPTTSRAEEAAVAPIQQLNEALMNIMKAGVQVPFEKRFDMLAPVIDRVFDLEAILQESVGLTWPNLPPDQQAMLEKAFRRYTVASYVNSFDSYNGQRFEVAPETRAAGSEQIVSTKIIPASGSGHDLDYVMRRNGQAWRVVDVLADGSISRVAVQRSDFRRLLTRGGASALAESLSTKSADLSEGTG